MSDRLIRSLYEGRLNTWAAAHSPVLLVAWENNVFTPPAGIYLQAFILPADTTSQDLAGAMRNRAGIFQISIVAPLGNGPGAAEAISAELETLFPNNLRLTSGSFVVQSITPLRLRAPIPDAGRYIRPVDFQYRADEA